MKLHKPQRLGSDPCRARAPHAPCARSDGRANPHGNQILSAPAICAAISFLQLGKSEWGRRADAGFGTESVEKKLRVHIGMKESLFEALTLWSLGVSAIGKNILGVARRRHVSAMPTRKGIRTAADSSCSEQRIQKKKEQIPLENQILNREATINTPLLRDESC